MKTSVLNRNIKLSKKNVKKFMQSGLKTEKVNIMTGEIGLYLFLFFFFLNKFGIIFYFILIGI